MGDTELMIVNLKKEVALLRSQRERCTCSARDVAEPVAGSAGAPGASSGPTTLEDYMLEVSRLNTALATAEADASALSDKVEHMTEEMNT
jgi:hypothetical protein